MIEMDKPVNIHTVKQEIEDDRRIRNKSKDEEKEKELNPYQMAILNKKSKDDAKTEQMINWSIFSDRNKYVDGSFCSSMTPSLTIRPLDDKRHKTVYNSLKTDEAQIPDIIFDEDRIRDTYLDKYDGIQAEISHLTKFDESADLSTTYLGKTNVTREHVMKAEERFPISGQGYTNGKLLD